MCDCETAHHLVGVVVVPEPEAPPERLAKNPPKCGKKKKAVRIERWITKKDSRVCSICEPLQGRRFQQGHGPRPVRDTHENCRCRRVFARYMCIPRGTVWDDGGG